MGSEIPLDVLLQSLLSPSESLPCGRTTTEVFADWWSLYRTIAAQWSPFDRAVIGGFLTDKLAFAFAGGYQSALQCLVPALSHDNIASLAVSEEGGAHPRAIQAIISPDPDDPATFRISGHKKWITCAAEAQLLLVAVSAGVGADGRNKIRIAWVPSTAEGVSINVMQSVGIVPEISHGEIDLDNVAVAQDALMPGDGYTQYIRPFRTVEDIYVGGGIWGYLFGIAREFNWETAVCEEILAIITSLRSLSEADPAAPATHLALGGVLSTERKVVEAMHSAWELVDADTRVRWERDSALLNVAEKVRAARLAAAWEKFSNKI
ncbi:MAG TPA: acyl-CoA dehydrogenase family protein [Candidatus Lokiarchaeia archaeon]|nr:acyl-CoA dehydrogenase family protein [Candidatus Lokiarchaeia archaeon]